MISKAIFDQTFSIKGETIRERAVEMLNKWKRFNIQMEEVCKNLSNDHPKNKLMRIHRKDFYIKLSNSLEKHLEEINDSNLENGIKGMLIGQSIVEGHNGFYKDTIDMATVELSRILGLEFEVKQSDGTITKEK